MKRTPLLALATVVVALSVPAASFAATTGTLWTTTVAQHPWQVIVTDVRIQNLMNYDDAIAAGTTNYTNTLTYTVVAQ